MTPDGLISALQGKLQQEAEKAVQAALAKQLSDVVREALNSIDDARRSSVREVREILPERVEAMRVSLGEESARELTAQWKADVQIYRDRVEDVAQRLETQIADLRRELANAQECLDKVKREIVPEAPARLKEVVSQAASDFEGATAITVDRRYERLSENVQMLTREALLNLNARSKEVQALVQSTVNSGLEGFRREAELHVNMVLAETKERAISILSSLDAKSRANCQTWRQAVETDFALSAEGATEQFRKGMRTFLHSCLVAAVGAVDERSKATLDGLLKDDGNSI